MSDKALTALVEAGIGETRALVLDGDTIVEAHIERDDDSLRAGDIWTARLSKILVPGRRGIVLAGDAEALLEPLPPGLTEGGLLRVEVVREAIAEAGRARMAKVAARSGALRGPGRVSHGPHLTERLRARGFTLTEVDRFGPDALEAAGWSETLEAAQSGHASFPGGLLTISPTPAMTVIDVDGAALPEILARAAATAAAAAIRRFDICGSIGIDFPTIADKAQRTRIGELLDQGLPVPFERTAINGFGFVQIVRPRLRPSLIETLRTNPVTSAALALLRRGERTPGAGDRVIYAAAAVVDWLGSRPDLTRELECRCGSHVRLQADSTLGLGAGHVAIVARNDR